MIPIHILGIRKTPEGNVILLQEEGDQNTARFLPIFIGRFESNAIEAALEGHQPPRPMTHDLMMTFLDRVGIKLVAVEIIEMRDQTYFADIVLEIPVVDDGLPDGIEEPSYMRISSRPSDAIALAVRTEAPISATEEVMDSSGLRMADLESSTEDPEVHLEDDGEIEEYDDVPEEEMLKKFKDFIEHVKPQDFEDPLGEN